MTIAAGILPLDVYTDYKESSASGPPGPQRISEKAAQLGTWVRKNLEPLVVWPDRSALLQNWAGTASLTDIRTDIDIFQMGVAASRRLDEYKYANGIQAPLSFAFRSIDIVAQYSAAHIAEWTPITSATVDTAKDLVFRCHTIVAHAGEIWSPVHISSDAEGGISFEWWNKDRTLTLFAHSDRSTSYLFAWGLNIWTEMETGENPDDSLLLSLWLRLNEGE